MSSLINKVKDAVRGDHSDPGHGKHGMSDAERAKYGTSTQAYDKDGQGHSSELSSSQATSADTGNFIGAGQMNPTSTSSDPRGSSNLPGSFPGSQHEQASSRHKDGREYVPPTGTLVSHGQTEQSGGLGYDRGEKAVPGRDSSGRYGEHETSSHRYVQPTSSNAGYANDRHLMDPASHEVGSNVMGGTSAVADGEDSSHHKLHKRDDPRSYNESNDPSSHHSSKHHGIHGTHGRHETSGTHQETIGGQPYEQQAGQGYSADNTTGKHHGHSGTGATAAGGFAGSQLSGRHQGDTEREGTSGLGRSTGHNYDNAPGANSGHGTQPREAGDSRLGAAALGAGSGAAGLASHQHNREREHEQSGYGRETKPGYGISSTQPGTTSSGYGSSTQPPGLTSSSGPTPGYSNSNQPTNSAAQPSSSGAPGDLGPPPGAKVMHRCTKCGEDNDISHYFKKDIVYRISH